MDLDVYLKNHAIYYKEYKKIDKNDLSFNFSFLDIQFFKSGQPPEKTLFELLQELKKPAEYKVKNGYYITKNGEKKPKYTTRKINLNDVIKIEAIHITGSEGEYVMPHIHLVLSKNARLGKDFSLLKTHIIEVSKKFGLRPNFAELPKNNPASYKNLAKTVKNFSWIIRKMPNPDFKKYVETKLQDKLDKLWKYTLLSNNLQYYIKTFEFIKKRLNRQKLEFKWQGHNLQNTYPIPLTQEDLEIIDLINKKKFSQKDIKPYLNNAIMRDFVRYSYFKDKNKALIINSLSKQTELLQNLRPNKKVIDNYLKLYKKTLNFNKQQQLQEQQKEKEIKSIKEILKNDLIKIAKTCLNEKELREKMQEEGYKEFGFKKKQGKVYAYQFKLPAEDKKIIVKCADSINIKEIRAILKENWIKSKKNETIKSNISNERSQINTYLLPKPLETPQPVPVTYKTQEIEEQKEKQKTLMRKRREYERNYKTIRELIAITTTNATSIKLFTSELARDTQREFTIKRDIRELAKRELQFKRRFKENIRNNRRGFQKYKAIRIYAELAKRIQNTITELKRELGTDIQNRITKVRTTISNGITELKRRIRKLGKKISEGIGTLRDRIRGLKDKILKRNKSKSRGFGM